MAEKEENQGINALPEEVKNGLSGKAKKSFSLNRFFATERDVVNDELEDKVPDLVENALKNPTGSFQRQSNKVNLELKKLNKTASELNQNIKTLSKKLDKIKTGQDDSGSILGKLLGLIALGGGLGAYLGSFLPDGDTIIGEAAGGVLGAGAATYGAKKVFDKATGRNKRAKTPKSPKKTPRLRRMKRLGLGAAAVAAGSYFLSDYLDEDTMDNVGLAVDSGMGGAAFAKAQELEKLNPFKKPTAVPTTPAAPPTTPTTTAKPRDVLNLKPTATPVPSAPSMAPKATESFWNKTKNFVSDKASKTVNAAKWAGGKLIKPAMVVYAVWNAWDQLNNIDKTLPRNEYYAEATKIIAELVKEYGIIWISSIFGAMVSGAIGGTATLGLGAIPSALVGFVSGVIAGAGIEYMIGDDITSVVNTVVDYIYGAGAYKEDPNAVKGSKVNLAAGEQGIRNLSPPTTPQTEAQNGGSPAATELRKQRARDESADMQSKVALAQDFAIKMGMSPDNVQSKMEGGVPTEINGVPVPDELYTDDQRNKIKAAREMRAVMEKNEKLMGGISGGSNADLPAVSASPSSLPATGYIPSEDEIAKRVNEKLKNYPDNMQNNESIKQDLRQEAILEMKAGKTGDAAAITPTATPLATGLPVQTSQSSDTTIDKNVPTLYLPYSLSPGKYYLTQSKNGNPMDVGTAGVSGTMSVGAPMVRQQSGAMAPATPGNVTGPSIAPSALPTQGVAPATGSSGAPMPSGGGGGGGGSSVMPAVPAAQRRSGGGGGGGFFGSTNRQSGGGAVPSPSASAPPPSAPSATPSAPSAPSGPSAIPADVGGIGGTSTIDERSKKIPMKGVDNRMKVVGDAAIRAFEKENPGYSVRVISGDRPGAKTKSGTPSKHAQGHAIDYEIVGPDGKALPSLGDPTHSSGMGVGAKAGDSAPKYLEFMKMMEAARVNMASKDPSYDKMGKISPGLFFKGGAWMDSMHASFGEGGALGDVYNGFKSPDQLRKEGTNPKIIEAVERAIAAGAPVQGDGRGMTEKDMQTYAQALYDTGVKPEQAVAAAKPKTATQVASAGEDKASSGPSAAADTPAPTATEAKGQMSDDQIRKIMESPEQVKPGEDNISAGEIKKGFEGSSEPPDSPLYKAPKSTAASAPAPAPAAPAPAVPTPTPNAGRSVPGMARGMNPMQQMMGALESVMSGGNMPNTTRPTPLPSGIGDFAFKKGEMPYAMMRSMARDSQGVSSLFDVMGGAAGLFASGGQEPFQ